MESRYFRCEACRSLNRIPVTRLSEHPRCGRCSQELATLGAPIHLSDDELDNLIQQSPIPILVDFHADWCAPCRSLAPILSQVAAQYGGRLFVVKIDTEHEKRKARELGVQGIPAVYLFKGGKMVEKTVGLRPFPFWMQWVEPHVG